METNRRHFLRTTVLTAGAAALAAARKPSTPPNVVLIIAVDQEHAQGIARLLMEAARRLAIDSGADGLSLSTGTGNLPAQSLYEALGYYEIPRLTRRDEEAE